MGIYTPLSDMENPYSIPEPEPNFRKHIKRLIVFITFSCMLIILSLMALILIGPPAQQAQLSSPGTLIWRRMKHDVSEKLSTTTEGLSFPWTNDMLTWQRSGFHFQPKKNWMNDPNGPLYYKGYYHFFYQYNPDSAIWGNITWGHAVSTDLIHWKELPFAMVPDHWYDISGVWTGSATILPDGNIVMLYTGGTEQNVQVQNLAYPANLSDPLLIDWVKYPGNPVVTPPSGIGSEDFRDPSTAWVDHNGVWRFIIGSKKGKTGISLVYKTRNFKTYELEGTLHGVPGTGMWECVDFYPVSTRSQNGLDASANGPGMKHLLKASLQDIQQDHYALGTYDLETQTWTPDNPEMDVGKGFRLDYGKFYASKTFFDQRKQRRILWGWVAETDTKDDDLLKGWASLQAIPRAVTYDTKTGTNILQWPVEELESLRKDYQKFDNIQLHPGSIVNLNVTSATQMDVSAEFVIDQEALNSTVGDDVINNCTPSAIRNAVGPFGLLVLADESLSELTPVYFYIAKDSDGNIKKWFCTDLSRSSKAYGVDDEVHGGPVTVVEGENYNMRLLVDHSIVEAFAQGGRACITSRIYPTRAVNGNAKVFLFNNASDSYATASVNVWRLDSN